MALRLSGLIRAGQQLCSKRAPVFRGFFVCVLLMQSQWFALADNSAQHAAASSSMCKFSAFRRHNSVVKRRNRASPSSALHAARATGAPRLLKILG